eukprot:1697525-Alexandrium_andersonii.AAC.1
MASRSSATGSSEAPLGAPCRGRSSGNACVRWAWSPSTSARGSARRRRRPGRTRKSDCLMVSSKPADTP